MSATDGLSPDEDEELRRLHWFETNGSELSDDRRRLKATIAARDRRSYVRLPQQVGRVIPAPAPPDADTDIDTDIEAD